MNALITGILVIALLRGYETAVLDRHREKGEVRARWTLLLLTVNYALTVLSAAAEAWITKRPLIVPLIAFGALLMVLRLLLKLSAVKTLGKYWSANIEIRADHTLLRTGPYRFVRHPTYLSNLMDVAAVSLVLGAYYTLCWSLPVQGIIIALRIAQEERAMQTKFGEAYRHYRRKTYALLPFVR